MTEMLPFPEPAPAPAPAHPPGGEWARLIGHGHAAAADGGWRAAAVHFDEAVAWCDAASDSAEPSVERATALSNLGQALARAGQWDAAEAALRRAAAERDALVGTGRAARAASARGWSDLAALLAVSAPEEEAAAALARGEAAFDGATQPALAAALAETRALVGGVAVTPRGDRVPAFGVEADAQGPALDWLELAPADRDADAVVAAVVAHPVHAEASVEAALPTMPDADELPWLVPPTRSTLPDLEPAPAPAYPGERATPELPHAAPLAPPDVAPEGALASDDVRLDAFAVGRPTGARPAPPHAGAAAAVDLPAATRPAGLRALLRRLVRR
jgi:hypothetical protein